MLALKETETKQRLLAEVRMLKHNRGDTFDFSGPLIVTVDGVQQVDMTGWTGRAMVRSRYSKFIDEIEFSWVDASQGQARIRKQNTIDWPPGDAYIDIQLTFDEGDKISTEPTLFKIRKDSTYD